MGDMLIPEGWWVLGGMGGRIAELHGGSGIQEGRGLGGLCDLAKGDDVSADWSTVRRSCSWRCEEQ